MWDPHLWGSGLRLGRRMQHEPRRERGQVSNFAQAQFAS
jgi:hypothetical protein